MNQFKDFLARYGNNPRASYVKFALATAMLELPDRSLQAINDLLNQASQDKNLPDYPQVIYTAGTVYRLIAQDELQQMEGKIGGARDNLRNAMRYKSPIAK